MTHDERTPLGPKPQPEPQLDAQLRELSLEVEPGRDLWPGIAARLEQQAAVPLQRVTRRPAWAWQAAAALVLVAGSSLLTASLLDRSPPPGQFAGQSASQPSGAAPDLAQGGASVLPAAFGPTGRLDSEYLVAREQLTRMLDERIASMPPAARAKLEFNLGEMRRAADEINAALAAQPGDPLLEELLLKTYQDELAVLSNVNQLTDSLQRGPAPTGEKRMQL
ncbi:MAG: hypothetical protein ACRC6L_00305 [Steroidobacteraceae bacterium]